MQYYEKHSESSTHFEMKHKQDVIFKKKLDLHFIPYNRLLYTF